MRIRANRCFCTKQNPLKCQGFSDLTNCYGGIPLAITFPHFINSPNLLKKVGGGLEPNENHISKVFIEPNLGITVAAFVRMQMNIQLEPFPLVSNMGSLQQMIMPLMWLEEASSLAFNIIFICKTKFC